MSIKQKTLALASEHGIEVWIGLLGKGETDPEFQVNLPKGFELDDATTGFSGHLDSRLSHYANWKALFLDVQALVEKKNTWKKITDVVEETKSIDALVSELKTTRKQKSRQVA
jgi:hypothetical protein